MKYNFSLFFFLLVCFSLTTINNTKKTSDYRKGNYFVNVLLADCEIGKGIEMRSFDLKSENGFLLSDGTPESKVFYNKSNKITISVKDNFIYINDKKYLKNKARISPKDGDINFGEYFYQGDFVFVLDHKKLYLMNKINLEDYVFAVLCSESWPNWPLEVNKVFAIAIRTYVTKRAQDAKRANRMYHIKNDNSHQTYRGYKLPNRNYDLLRTAVSKTDDLILTYNGDIIDPLYDCCCGGIIPADIEGKINFKKAPYLARKYSCPYCKKCKQYSWETTYDIKDLEELLDIKNILSISVTKKDKAGLVKEVQVKVSGKRKRDNIIKLTGDKLHKYLKRIKSFCYSIKKQGGKFVISGKGHGHHIGICQWGAREMVRQSFDFKQILSFYYPGSKLSLFPRE